MAKVLKQVSLFNDLLIATNESKIWPANVVFQFVSGAKSKVHNRWNQAFWLAKNLKVVFDYKGK